MKLIKVRVEAYKCVEDSTEFDIDQVTCLVGKNEAGKTAILEALHKLNPIEISDADFDEKEFPRRHLATGREREERESARILTATWELEEGDVQAVEEATTPGAVKGRRIVTTKGYDNVRRWRLEGDGQRLLDEAAVVSTHVNEMRFNASESSQIGQVTSVAGLKHALVAGKASTPKLKSLADKIEAEFPDGIERKVRELLAPRLPRFVYFAEYHALPGRVSLHELRQKVAQDTLEFSDRIFLALLEMTSTGLDEIDDLSDLESLIMELEAVEASLTDTIKKYWTQNRHLEVRFRKDVVDRPNTPPRNQDVVISTRVFNTRHRATVNFDERSAGFIWFFSFLVWFSQVRNNYGKNIILLLDEPGLTLHGKAQQDLLRYINEELRPHHQVLYTSHSPFMIDVEHVFSLRSVEDVVEIEEDDGNRVEHVLGTKVGQRILSRDRDTLFPLQGVLGFDVAQTLFVGPYVVVVEGPTEKAAFDWFARELARRGRDTLDIRWAVCPAEGAGKISSFVTLFSGRGLKIAVFTDYHEGQKGMIDRLAQSGLLEEGHLLKTTSYAEQEDADIEDLVGRTLYIHLVNASLGLRGGHAIPAERGEDAPPRVVKEVEAFCKLLPPGYPEFDHYRPFEHLRTLPVSAVQSLPGLDVALDRFERVFKDLNRLIPPGEY